MVEIYLRSIFALSVLLAAAQASAAAPAITLEVDAGDVTQGIQHAHLVIPVHPGPIALAYPKWIPGEHAANGPITQLVSLEITAGGKALPWHRDQVDGFLFHLEVPPDTTSLDIRFDYLSPPKAFADGYGRTPNVTPHLLVLSFNHLVLVPQDAKVDLLPVRATVRLPAGWKFDGPLRPERVERDTLVLPTVPLATLVDSPILAGEHFRSVTLRPGAGGTRISIAADAPGDLAVSEAWLTALGRLEPEAVALFGPGHYREYVWLVALGNDLDWNGLEHHESTDIRDNEALFTDPERLLAHTTAPHEYVHSWNGKYRRPAGLATSDFQQPMVDDLLWEYEGMTRYLGDLVLRARSGLSTPQGARAYLAWVASRIDLTRPGRAWRSLGDTATSLPAYADAPAEWTPIRRGRDFYDEMLLAWLDADTLIRESSGGQHSLDDFSAGFFGGPERSPAVRPYARADVVIALRAVAPIDWEAFLAERVDGIATRAPLAGIERSGWRLAFDDEPNEYLSALEKVTKTDNLSLSLGLWSKADGLVADVVHGSPAFAAGVAPGVRLLAIGGRKWSAAAARDVLVKSERAAEPIELVVESADLVRLVRVDYHGGLRNPRLVRDAIRPDLLSRILAPRVPTAEAPRRQDVPDHAPGLGRWPLPRGVALVPPM